MYNFSLRRLLSRISYKVVGFTIAAVILSYFFVTNLQDNGTRTRYSLSEFLDNRPSFNVYGANASEVKQQEKRFSRDDYMPSQPQVVEREELADESEMTDEERFRSRREHLHNMCQDPERSNFKWFPRESGNVTERALYDCKLKFCRVPKVGSTYLSALKIHRATVNHHFMSNRRYSCRKLLPPLPRSFLIVRDPYVRIVSGYFDKIVTIPWWWRNYGAFIVNKFRGGNVSPDQVGCGHDVTFEEFVRFLVYSDTAQTMQDPHFIPVHKLCNVCEFNFDYLGKLETFTQDLKYIYESVGESSDFDFSPDLMKVSNKTQYFRSLFEKEDYSKCTSICEGMQKVWYGLQSMGFIPRSYNFPFLGERCNSVSPNEFREVSVKAYTDNKGKFDKHKQKDDFLRDVYSQVDIKYKLELYKVLKRDLDFFGYPHFPESVFPEYAGKQPVL